ncbi:MULTISPECIES: DUF3619 family protein [unclassified Janthinobacterium]|uniref:DUF3619 family protein n=1 Tax=unclassified Janthinobacterium TaxID=2610881 RepID=UPI00161E6B7C|nr:MULTISPECIES: DUF3619 family protein [unclassified Janthinobacterium]MBB5367057.1 hypothetical protein [Janthinobacterium sp. K2C7]MBB5380465.1 hypothetical protein [Janthinobacterium sp. K2Li3]MBB5385439.1 hypothetical protein [Janthinobacterium sp. K2E3]
MNTDDLNFAYKVRHALNEKLDDLPASTTDRLALARKAALSRKKADAPVKVLARQNVLAGIATHFFAEPMAWLTRMSVIIPLLLLVAGLTGIYQFEQEQRVAELAELDAAVLSDELPLSAYMDHGFNAYLTKREQ